MGDGILICGLVLSCFELLLSNFFFHFYLCQVLQNFQLFKVDWVLTASGYRAGIVIGRVTGSSPDMTNLDMNMFSPARNFIHVPLVQVYS